MTGLVVVVDGIEDAGLATVDALVRLQMAAQRTGGSVQLYGAPLELVHILELAGLADVLPCRAGSDVEDERLAEVLEVLRADEVMDVRDTPA